MIRHRQEPGLRRGFCSAWFTTPHRVDAGIDRERTSDGHPPLQRWTEGYGRNAKAMRDAERWVIGVVAAASIRSEVAGHGNDRPEGRPSAVPRLGWVSAGQ